MFVADPRRKHRVPQLDILRAFAILLVLGNHLPPCPIDEGRIAHTLSLIWQRGGWIGVDLFFVLSGFLVSGLLFREYTRHRVVSIRSFLFRRGFKIYPAFWVLLAFAAWLRLRDGGRVPKRLLFGEVTFLQNYVGGLMDHTWTLAVEEHFYFLLVFLVAILAKIGKGLPPENVFRSIGLIFGFTAVFCLAFRIRNNIVYPKYDFILHCAQTHLRLDSLMFGVLLSYYWHFKRSVFDFGRVTRGILLALACGILVLPFAFQKELHPWMSMFGLSLLWFAFGVILIFVMQIEVEGNRWTRPLEVIGSHSYSIYLWHPMVLGFGITQLRHVIDFGEAWNWYWFCGIYVAGSILVGIAMAKIVELPLLRLRDALVPSRSG